MVFICLNNFVPKYLANIFLPRSHIHTRTTQCTLLHIPCFVCHMDNIHSHIVDADFGTVFLMI